MTESDVDIIIRRYLQKKETWISNVKRIYGWTKEEAQLQFARIRPYKGWAAAISDQRDHTDKLLSEID